MGRRNVTRGGRAGGQTLLETALAQATTPEAIREIQCAISSIENLRKEMNKLDKDDRLIIRAMKEVKPFNRDLYDQLGKMLKDGSAELLQKSLGRCENCIKLSKKINKLRANLHHYKPMGRKNKAERKNKKAKYKLIYFQSKQSLKNPWIAHVYINGKRKYVGIYETEELAYEAQQAKYKELENENEKNSKT